MDNVRIPVSLYLLLLIVGLLQWARNWQPKQAFFLVMLVAVFASAIPAFIVPRRLASMPADRMNLPNKSYWLAPQRRQRPGNFSRRKWRGSVVRCFSFCSVPLATPSTRTFPALATMIRKRCGL